MLKATGSDRPLTIAVASGKGGTGKTTFSVALALAAGVPSILMDCDVEEPNAALFLSKESTGAATREQVVSVPMPIVDESACSGCGACAKMCRYNAIILLKKDVTIFPDLCHSCGGCSLVCPEGAIREEPKTIGHLREWNNGGLRFIQGELDVGLVLSPPLVRAVKKRGEACLQDPDGGARLRVIDSPPGTSCPMSTAVRGADFVLLVTEPTPFGLHDLKLAVDAVEKMGLPFGVAINRCDLGDSRVVEFCGRRSIPIVAQIPNDRRVAEAYSEGKSLLSASESYRTLIREMYERIKGLAAAGGSV